MTAKVALLLFAGRNFSLPVERIRHILQEPELFILPGLCSGLSGVFMFEDELIPILGAEGAVEGRDPFMTVSPDDVAQDYNFKIVAGSTLPRNRERDAKKAMTDIQIAGTNPDLHNLPKVYEKYWIARGENPAKMIKGPDQQQPALPGMEQEKGRLDPAAFAAMDEGRVQ